MDKQKQERPERREGKSQRGLAERLLAIGGACAARLKEPHRTIDHGELLYEDKGLPR